MSSVNIYWDATNVVKNGNGWMPGLTGQNNSDVITIFFRGQVSYLFMGLRCPDGIPAYIMTGRGFP